MALWDLICDKCGAFEKDVDIPISVDTSPPCKKCNTPMRKDYSTIKTVVHGDVPEHYNESLGCWVKSGRDLRAKLWENNARTETIDPKGGLTKEERAEMRGDTLPRGKTVFERRKEPFWDTNPSSPEDGLYSE